MKGKWRIAEPDSVVSSDWLDKIRAAGIDGVVVFKDSPPWLLGEMVAIFANKADAERVIASVNRERQ